MVSSNLHNKSLYIHFPLQILLFFLLFFWFWWFVFLSCTKFISQTLQIRVERQNIHNNFSEWIFCGNKRLFPPLLIYSSWIFHFCIKIPSFLHVFLQMQNDNINSQFNTNKHLCFYPSLYCPKENTNWRSDIKSHTSSNNSSSNSRT